MIPQEHDEGGFLRFANRWGPCPSYRAFACGEFAGLARGVSARDRRSRRVCIEVGGRAGMNGLGRWHGWSRVARAVPEPGRPRVRLRGWSTGVMGHAGCASGTLRGTPALQTGRLWLANEYLRVRFLPDDVAAHATGRELYLPAQPAAP